MKLISQLALVGLLAYSHMVYGQIPCSISADAYFVNGVNNPSKERVIDKSLLLKEAISHFSKKTSGIRNLTYLYNESDGLLSWAGGRVI